MPEVERPEEVALRRLEADWERARLLRSQPKEGREADFGVRTAYLRGFIEPWNMSTSRHSETCLKIQKLVHKGKDGVRKYVHTTTAMKVVN